MKRILYSICIGSLAVALTAGAANDNKRKPERASPQHRTANVHAARPANTGRTMSAHRNVSAAQYRQRSYAKPRTSSNAVVKHNTGLRAVQNKTSRGTKGCVSGTSRGTKSFVRDVTLRLIATGIWRSLGRETMLIVITILTRRVLGTA